MKKFLSSIFIAVIISMSLLNVQAQEMETKILKDYKEFKYLGEPLLSTGNSELFNTNILSL